MGQHSLSFCSLTVVVVCSTDLGDCRFCAYCEVLFPCILPSSTLCFSFTFSLLTPWNLIITRETVFSPLYGPRAALWFDEAWPAPGQSAAPPHPLLATMETYNMPGIHGNGQGLTLVLPLVQQRLTFTSAAPRLISVHISAPTQTHTHSHAPNGHLVHSHLRFMWIKE